MAYAADAATNRRFDLMCFPLKSICGWAACNRADGRHHVPHGSCQDVLPPAPTCFRHAVKHEREQDVGVASVGAELRRAVKCAARETGLAMRAMAAPSARRAMLGPRRRWSRPSSNSMAKHATPSSVDLLAVWTCGCDELGGYFGCRLKRARANAHASVLCARPSSTSVESVQFTFSSAAAPSRECALEAACERGPARPAGCV